MALFKNDHHACRRQRRYMRYQLYFTTSNVLSFLHRLKQLNKYLKYFPIPPQNKHVHPLSDNELMEIIDNAKPLEYNQYMLQSNYDPYDKSLEEFCQYLASLELSMKFTAAVSATKSNSSNKKRKEKASNNDDDDDVKVLHKCKHCKKMVTHEAKDCWMKPGNESKMPAWMKNKRRKTSEKSGSEKKKNPSFTGEQLSFLIQNAHFAASKGKKTKSVKKRQITYKQHSESESDNNEEVNVLTKMSKFVDSDEITTTSEQSEMYFSTSIFNKRPRKRLKEGHVTTEIIGEIINNNKEITPIRCLLDTGTTATIVLKPFATTISKYKGSKTKWRTMGGAFETKRKAKLEFKLPEFSHNKVITWVAHVDEVTAPNVAQYDMIIGTDLISKLKIKIDYDVRQIEWDNITVPR